MFKTCATKQQAGLRQPSRGLFSASFRPQTLVVFVVGTSFSHELLQEGMVQEEL